MARRFGLIAAAGELATAHGLTGWRLDEAENAVRSAPASQHRADPSLLDHRP
jgi:hypothetical protein